MIHLIVVTPAEAGAQWSVYAYVYIVTNRRYGTLYVGVTGDLPGRVLDHRHGTFEGFSKEHGLHRLVWYEAHDWIMAAIEREKRIKCWRRDWKVNLIQSVKPGLVRLLSVVDRILDPGIRGNRKIGSRPSPG